METLEKIKEDHVILKSKIFDLDNTIKSKSQREIIHHLFNEIETFWAEHEIREEEFFNEYEKSSPHFPFTAMFIKEHKELKGHWHVIKDFIENRNDKELHIALETDGQMLLEKFRNHINKEDKYIDKHLI
jgi:hypothetical protein